MTRSSSANLRTAEERPDRSRSPSASPSRSGGAASIGWNRPSKRMRGIMTTEASLAYAEQYRPEDEHLRAARANAEAVGVVPVLPGARAALTFLAGAAAARNIAGVGTGTGVSGLALLRGMAPDGVLTSVDREAENQRLAREVFLAAGIAPTRFRLITGSALDVLPRLNDGGYDLVF